MISGIIRFSQLQKEYDIKEKVGPNIPIGYFDLRRGFG